MSKNKSALDVESIIGKEVRRLRKNNNLTQDVLSDKAGLSPAYIGQIERGERIPSFSSLSRIANAMDMTAGEVLANLARQISHPFDEKRFVKAVEAMSGCKQQFLSGIIDLIEMHFVDKKEA